MVQPVKNKMGVRAVRRGWEMELALALVLALLLGGAALLTSERYHSTMELARNEAMDTAVVMAEHVAGTLGVVDLILVSLTDDLQNGLDVTDTQALSARFARRAALGPNVQNLLWFGADGSPVYGMNPASAGLLDTARFDLAARHNDLRQAFAIVPVIDPQTGMQSLAVSRRMDRPAGGTSGFLVAVLASTFLSDRMERFTLDLPGGVELSDMRGRRLLCTDASDECSIGLLVDRFDLDESDLAGGMILQDQDGVLVASARVPGFALRTTLLRERAVILAEWWNAAAITWSVVLVAVVGAVLLYVRVRTLRRQVAQSALLHSAFFHSARDPIFIGELGGLYLDANPAALQALGVGLDVVRETEQGGFTCPQGGVDVAEVQESLRTTGHAFFETVHCRADGSRFPVEVSVSTFERDGRTLFVGLWRDISRRKAAEAERDAARKTMDAVFDAIPGVVVVMDRDLHVVNHNRQYRDYAAARGLTLTEGMTCYEASHGRTSPCPVCCVQEAMESGLPASRISSAAEVARYGRYQRHDAVPLTDDDGEVWGAVELVMDITDIKQAEQEAREASERLNLVIEAARLGTWDWDMASNEQTMNERWSTMLGYTPAHLPRSIQSWWGLIHPDDLPRVEQAVEGLVHNGHANDGSVYDGSGLYVVEMRMQTADGGWRWVMSSGRVVERDAEGRPLRAAGIHLDIDDRRTAEEEARHTSERLNLVLDAARLGTWEWDGVQRCQYVNEQWYAMLGYETKADCIDHQEWLEMIHPDDVPAVQQQVYRFTEENLNDFLAEYRIQTASGGWKWILSAGRVTRRDKDGRATDASGIHLDIDDRRRAEEAARALRQHYESIVEDMNEQVLRYSPQGRLTYANAACMRFFALTEDTVHGYNWLDTLADAEERDRVQTLLDRCTAITPAFATEVAVHAPCQQELGEDTRWLYITARAHFGPDGTLYEFQSTALDITDRVSTEEQLKDSNRQLLEFAHAQKKSQLELQDANRRLAALFDNSMIGILLVVKGRIIERANSRLGEMLGYSPDELEGQSAHMLHVDDEHYREFGSYYQTVLAQGRVYQQEYRFRRKDGSTFWAEINGRALDPSNLDAGVIWTLDDITRRKEAETLREDVERITRHDLRTPVSAAVYAPQLLADAGPLNEDQREILQMVEDAAYRALNMISLSLDLYRMEQGTYTLQARPFDLRAEVETVRREVQPVLLAGGLTLEVRSYTGEADAQVADDGPFMAWGERLLVYSLVANLLKNAAEAAPARSTVTVTLDRMDAEAASAESDGRVRVACVRMRIHNLGAVDPRVRNRLFEKYATAGKEGGTGLGTYSARLIARTHGGEVTCTTSEAEGTTFSVLLPENPSA